jgi:hypothetical protein
MCGGLIVVRAGVSLWVEAYDNLALFGSFWVKPKRTRRWNCVALNALHLTLNMKQQQ